MESNPTVANIIEKIGGLDKLPSLEIGMLETAIVLMMVASLVGGSLIAAVVFFCYGNLVLVLWTKLMFDIKVKMIEEKTSLLEDKITKIEDKVL